jgi:putative hydrolase of HD superfamily|tara:strand:+ start:604 stop:1224 length:621 start_codon:yes stop_codon:yes gene_type:complete
MHLSLKNLKLRPIMQELTQIIGFVKEIDKLKAVLRKTRPMGMERYENSAEHSWQVTLAALMLKDYAAQTVDINRVIRMLLIHDLCEIDTGDVIVYDAVGEDHEQAEAAATKRILGMLPNNMGDEYITLWHEFEAANSADARFAKALDRALPLMHNLNDQGHSWITHGITKEQVKTVNGSRIKAGCPQLWDLLEPLVDDAQLKGWLC